MGYWDQTPEQQVEVDEVLAKAWEEGIIEPVGTDDKGLTIWRRVQPEDD